MGNRQDDRSSRMGNGNVDPRQGGGGRDAGGRDGMSRQARGPERGTPGRAFDADEDMGGSGWSGASGRGGVPQRGRYPDPSGHSARSEYERDPEYGRDSQSGYVPYGDYADLVGFGDEDEGRSNHDQGAFLMEDRPGHIPGQRWSGGYGGDRDRAGFTARPDGRARGRGFTGNDFNGGLDTYRDHRDYRDYRGWRGDRPGRPEASDRRDMGGGSDFGGLPRRRERAYGAPAELAPRRFGNEVDRGGRMGPGGGETTTGRGYWGWESDRASGINVGQMGGREGWNLEGEGGRGGYAGSYGYGYQGTDMGMGVSDEQRGPHYGKGPKGYKRSDERTRDDVCDAIAHQGYIDASDVEVKVENGIVTLSGAVAQRQEKRKLEHLVERCRGVQEVHNELRLKREERSPAAAAATAGAASKPGAEQPSDEERKSESAGSPGANGKSGKPARA